MIVPIWRSDLTFSWFASGHSFAAVLLCKIMGKRSAVVAGGYDVAYEPEIDYGQYTLPKHKRMYADIVLRNADIILPVSEFTRSEVLARVRPKRIQLLYPGIDTDEFRPQGEKEDLVMTVASSSGRVIRLKGLNSFIGAAALLPGVRFLVVGLSEADREELQSKAAENVLLSGYETQEELLAHYQKAKVYCQLSYRESFGMALVEAMACGCAPVVTERGALPEVVGDTGYYVPYGNIRATAEAIEKALSSKRGLKARERVEEKFSLKKREQELRSLLEGLSR
ncbi:MAG: glycosyltransferase family 4 protein [Methanothrix sp.]|uniref:glycosyltransferase family 4 protein n=2 Tax=Methanothrix sp. TaxID=90426 RepID=UPI00316AC76C